mgnify:CR=1 FL=1
MWYSVNVNIKTGDAMKIIGKIKTKEITINAKKLDSVYYNVVSIHKFPNGTKVFITDKMHKPEIPLMITENLVEFYKDI